MTVAVRRARASGLPRERARLVPALERRFAIEVAGVFRGMLGRVGPDVRRVAGFWATKADPTLEQSIELSFSTQTWHAEQRVLLSRTAKIYDVIAVEGASAGVRDLGLESAINLGDYGIDEVLGDIGTRITKVTNESKRRIARMIADGIEKGLSVEQIVRGVAPGTTRSIGQGRVQVPAFPGIAGLVDSWSSTGVGRLAGSTGLVPLPSSRAYLIAITETGNAFNASALDGYRRSGLVDFVEVFDGPDCGWSQHRDPDLAHGSLRSLDEAKARPLSHPRCQRAFAAALGATSSRPSPYLGRDPGNVPGAAPGLRPDDLLPFSGRIVPRAPAAIDPLARVATNTAAREAALELAAERIRYTTTHETAVVVDDFGNVILDKSDPTRPRSVGFDADEVRLMRGATITHNHPGAYQTDLLHATSLSPDDIDLLLESGAREIRAVGKGADYRMAVSDPAYYFDAKRREILGAVRRADVEVRAEVMPSVVRAQTRAGEILREGREAATRPAGGGFDFAIYQRAQQEAERVVKAATEEAERLHWHRVWRKIVAQFPGLDYEQILRPEKP